MNFSFSSGKLIKISDSIISKMIESLNNEFTLEITNRDSLLGGDPAYLADSRVIKSRVSRCLQYILNKKSHNFGYLKVFEPSEENENTKTDFIEKSKPFLEEVKKKVIEKLESYEELHIDGRIFNGRKPETQLCNHTALTDGNIWTLAEECHQQFFNMSIRKSPKLKMFICAFISALYSVTKNIYETADGKLARVYRLCKEKLGDMAGCGLRTIQKGFSWFRDEIKTCSDNYCWEQKAKDKWNMWNELYDSIKSYLSSHEVILAACGPH